jgi:predicted nucleic acid-binding Zn ribbon protein
MNTPEARTVYQRLRKKFGGYRSADKGTSSGSEPFGDFRDPGSMADAFEELTQSMGWAPSLARADLTEHWADIVGDDVAAHASPSGFRDGVLEILCDSSAWATQLRLMRKNLVQALQERFPQAGVSDIVVKAPGAPSWKHGHARFQGVARAILTGRNP